MESLRDLAGLRLFFRLCESLGDVLKVEVLCEEKAKLQSFQTIKVSSFIALRGSVTTSLIILIVNRDADVSLVKSDTGEAKHHSTACSSGVARVSSASGTARLHDATRD